MDGKKPHKVVYKQQIFRENVMPNLEISGSFHKMDHEKMLYVSTKTFC